MMTGNALPVSVEANRRYLDQLGIWHIVSRNPPVRSCADAAQRRRRLGHVGIPLADELKSNVGTYGDPAAGRYAVLHCRGHQRLDDDKVSHALGAPFRRIDEAELRMRFGIGYGTVTPFLFADRFADCVHQVVDTTVLERFYPPYTMMTNLGDPEYAVEFHPEEAFGRFPGGTCTIASIVTDAGARVPVSKNIGILTGNSPESGILLWQRINECIRTDPDVEFRGDVGFPRVLIESVPEMGLSMELVERYEDVRNTVVDAVRRLCERGANLIAIACNTTQYFSDDIEKVCAEYDAQFVSLAEQTARFLKDEGIERFDFLAIGPVSDFTTWSAFRPLIDEFHVEVPSEREIAMITELAFSVKREVVSSSTVNRLRDLVNGATKTETVLLALTELSIVFASQRRGQRSGKRFVDTLDILAHDIAARYLAERVAVGST